MMHLLVDESKVTDFIPVGSQNYPQAEDLHLILGA